MKTDKALFFSSLMLVLGWCFVMESNASAEASQLQLTISPLACSVVSIDNGISSNTLFMPSSCQQLADPPDTIAESPRPAADQTITPDAVPDLQSLPVVNSLPPTSISGTPSPAAQPHPSPTTTAVPKPADTMMQHVMTGVAIGASVTAAGWSFVQFSIGRRLLKLVNLLRFLR